MTNASVKIPGENMHFIMTYELFSHKKLIEILKIFSNKLGLIQQARSDSCGHLLLTIMSLFPVAKLTVQLNFWIYMLV